MQVTCRYSAVYYLQRSFLSRPRTLFARVIIHVLLLCICFGAAACKPNHIDDLPDDSGTALERDLQTANSWLFPKLPIPELQVSSGGHTIEGLRIGYSWPIDGEVRESDEQWPPPEIWDRFLVSSGDEIAITMSIPKGGPDLTPDGVAAHLTLWSTYFPPKKEEGVPLYEGECDFVEMSPKEDGSSVLRLSWKVPEFLEAQSDKSSVAYLSVLWEGIIPAQQVDFCWTMTAVSKKRITGSLAAARKFFDAVWEGDEKTLAQVSPAWLAEEDLQAGEPRLPLRASLPGRRDEILWKSPGQSFSLASEPSLFVRNFYSYSSSTSYDRAVCQIDYEVDVTDSESGESVRYFVFEEVHLAMADDGTWMVSSSSRVPVPGPSGLIGVSDLPEASFRDEEFGRIVKVGPFADVNPYYGQKWSDDGEWFAFTGSAWGVNGIWGVRRDGSRLVNLAGFDDVDVQLVDWAPGQHKVRFLAYGRHSRGPHAGETGYWIAEADVGTSEIRDVAFVAYPRVSFPDNVAVPEGRRYLVFRQTPSLWRIDLETGDVLNIADDVPSWDGLLTLRVSLSARFMAYGEYSGSDRQGFTVYDIEAGVQRFVGLPDVSDGETWAYFDRWTPQEELRVWMCNVDEVNQGEDASAPAGSTAIRLYSPDAELVEEISVSDMAMQDRKEDDRFGQSAWNADGSVLAVVVGSLGEPVVSYPSSMEYVPLQTRALCLWSREDGTLRKVADVSGEVVSLEWLEEGKALQAWFKPPGYDADAVQSGVRVYMDGTVVSSLRPVNGFAEDEIATFYTAVGGWPLVLRRDEEPASLFAEEGISGGLQITVSDVGPLRFDEPVVIPGNALAISGEVPDRYGQGANLVYLVVGRE